MTEYLTRMARDHAASHSALGLLDTPAPDDLARVVLLVDDDPETRLTHTRALAEELGQAVVVARDGAEAIARARRHRPAVVVVGVGLSRPGSNPAVDRPADGVPPRVGRGDRARPDGCALAAALRACPATANAWLIALTATGAPREAALAGFDQFLWKPVDVQHLALAVQAGLVRAVNTRG